MKYILKIKGIKQITHDVKRFRLEKPAGFSFIPGQATYVSINKSGWKGEERPFTFTCLNSDNFLEFTIKRYKEHKGVTDEIHKLKEGDELVIRKPFGTINYHGKGIFIAGGAGITPFLAIIRQLNKEAKLKGNKLIFSNKTKDDIILESELKKMFGKDLILTLTREKIKGYESQRIDVDFLKSHIKDFKQDFYICGPPEMVEDLKVYLKELDINVDSLIFEKR